jgi:hypothetical protein
MPAKKKILPQTTPFLKTAAEAIGTALGKLAVKTGVATPTSSTKRKRAPIATKKKVTSRGKNAVRKSTR